MHIFTPLLLLLSIIGILLTGCTQTPAPQQQTVAVQPERILDPRPQVRFTTDTNAAAEQLKIYVNTLYVGTVADFQQNTRPLRLLSGEHTIQIHYQNQLHLQQTLHLESGAVHFMHVPFYAPSAS